MTDNGGITVSRLVEHVLRGHELVVRPLDRPLLPGQELARSSNDLTGRPVLGHLNIFQKHGLWSEPSAYGDGTGFLWRAKPRRAAKKTAKRKRR
jgi:hypothetical protein